MNSIPTAPVPVGAMSLAFVTVCAFLVYNYSPELSQIGKSGLSLNGTSQNGAITAEPASRPVDHRMVASAPFSSQTAPFSHAYVPYDGPGRSSAVSWRFPTVADEIGADNLTVESPQIDLALKTLKEILPDIQGKLVDEKFRNAFGEALVAVIIPSRDTAILLRLWSTMELLKLGLNPGNLIHLRRLKLTVETYTFTFVSLRLQNSAL